LKNKFFTITNNNILIDDKIKKIINNKVKESLNKIVDENNNFLYSENKKSDEYYVSWSNFEKHSLTKLENLIKELNKEIKNIISV
jgi:hypothetical protein